MTRLFLLSTGLRQHPSSPSMMLRIRDQGVDSEAGRMARGGRRSGGTYRVYQAAAICAGKGHKRIGRTGRYGLKVTVRICLT